MVDTLANAVLGITFVAVLASAAYVIWVFWKTR